MLPERVFREVAYFALDEFDEKPWPPSDWPDYLDLPADDGRTHVIHPGKVIEACDKFAGFMEAYYSLSFGVRSANLASAIWPDEAGMQKRVQMNGEGYDLGPLYDRYVAELEEQGLGPNG